jgi:hypothetical protein
VGGSVGAGGGGEGFEEEFEVLTEERERGVLAHRVVREAGVVGSWQISSSSSDIHKNSRSAVMRGREARRQSGISA